MSFNRRDIGPLTQSRAAMARMSFRDIDDSRKRYASLTRSSTRYLVARDEARRTAANVAKLPELSLPVTYVKRRKTVRPMSAILASKVAVSSGLSAAAV